MKDSIKTKEENKSTFINFYANKLRTSHYLWMGEVGWQEWGNGHDESMRLEEGVIMIYIKNEGQPNLLYNINDNSNQNSAYMKKITC